MYNFQSFQSCFGIIEQHWHTMKIKTINKNLFILTEHFVNSLTKTFTLAYTLLICHFISRSEFLTKIVMPRYNRGKHGVKVQNHAQYIAFCEMVHMIITKMLCIL